MPLLCCPTARTVTRDGRVSVQHWRETVSTKSDLFRRAAASAPTWSTKNRCGFLLFKLITHAATFARSRATHRDYAPAANKPQKFCLRRRRSRSTLRSQPSRPRRTLWQRGGRVRDQFAEVAVTIMAAPHLRPHHGRGHRGRGSWPRFWPRRPRSWTRPLQHHRSHVHPRWSTRWWAPRYPPRPRRSTAAAATAGTEAAAAAAAAAVARATRLHGRLFHRGTRVRGLPACRPGIEASPPLPDRHGLRCRPRCHDGHRHDRCCGRTVVATVAVTAAAETPAATNATMVAATTAQCHVVRGYARSGGAGRRSDPPSRGRGVVATTGETDEPGVSRLSHIGGRICYFKGRFTNKCP